MEKRVFLPQSVSFLRIDLDLKALQRSSSREGNFSPLGAQNSELFAVTLHHTAEESALAIHSFFSHYAVFRTPPRTLTVLPP